MLGSWNIAISTNGMPQKVATAFGKLNDMVGAEYTPIAYLGSQVVNGTNHAVLAEQLVITGRDTKNIVLVLFRETADNITLTNIERVVVSGDPLGGISVNVEKNIPDEAKAAFDAAMEGHVGLSVKPFALVATQVTKGTDYLFAAVTEKVVKDPQPTVSIVTVNGLDKKIDSVKDVLNLDNEE